MNYVYNNTHLAIFNAAAPILWSIFVLWAIIATDNGYGGLNSTSSKIDRFLIGVNFILGWFGKLLCWKPFTLLSNISYAVYLVQYPVFFYFVGSSRGPSLHTITTMVFYLSTITWIPFCFHSKLQFIHYVFQFDVGQILLIMVLSVLLTLIIDMPFQKIGKHVTEGVYEKIKLF